MTRYAFETLRPEYVDLWSRMEVIKTAAATAQARTIISHKDRYKKVEQMTRDTGGPGVPWFVVGALHMRESSGSFTTWLHNGDPMKNRAGQPIKTTHEPPNRPPNPNVTWEDGAYDALITCEQLDGITQWGPEHVAYAAEKFNGFGYRNPSRNIPSPYLWGGTNIQKRGKFVADNVYDANEMDPQLGAMAVLKMLMQLDVEANFTAPTAQPPVTPSPPLQPAPSDEVPIQPSPRAGDSESEVKPLTKSKTMWGGLISLLGGMGGTIAGLFDKLDNPYTFSAFVIVMIGIGVGAFLVFKGRVDVNKIVEHLSDDTAGS